MQDGFIKVAVATPKLRVADCEYNGNEIIHLIDEGLKHKVKIMVFPELSITAYSCGDLFLHDLLLDQAMEQLKRIKEYTKGSDIVVCVGMPFSYHGALYNCGVWIQDDRILGIVPKTYLPMYQEFYEGRYFTRGKEEVTLLDLWGEYVPFGSRLLLKCEEMKELVLGCEICEDLWVPHSPSVDHCVAGATVIANLSASNEIVNKAESRKQLILMQSKKLCCGYLYTSVGDGESTTDVVYSGYRMIGELGKDLASSELFTTGLLIGELDVKRIAEERRKMLSFHQTKEVDGYCIQQFSLTMEETKLQRKFSMTPFVPRTKEKRENHCERILTLQALGLKKRLEHTNCKYSILGISGGLDSTLALLVTVRTYDLLSIPRNQIICVTMPCYGTTDRTYQNSIHLVKTLGATLREIPIHKAVDQHFIDIDHNKDEHNIVYENAQARERTQVLMDVANQYNGMVIGTGDMSELALGWATYNGDHMSMYGVNCSVPKTMVYHLVKYDCEKTENMEVKSILQDILDTPVSPELLPPVEGEIAQKTEEVVGPYELHDFFLYYTLRFCYPPRKVFRLAKLVFLEKYEEIVIYQWLRTFYWRFFSQQFKRSCLPDGPKVGSISLSPRGDFRMVSDVSSALWLKEMDKIKEQILVKE